MKTIFTLQKVFFDRMNHYHLLNEYVLPNFFAFYKTLIAKSNTLPSTGFAL